MPPFADKGTRGRMTLSVKLSRIRLCMADYYLSSHAHTYIFSWAEAQYVVAWANHPAVEVIQHILAAASLGRHDLSKLDK